MRYFSTALLATFVITGNPAVQAQQQTPKQMTPSGPLPKDAFSHVPRVELIQPARQEDQSDQPSTHRARRRYTLSEKIKKDNLRYYVSSWDGAAHFSLPRFGMDGERLDTEGVVIYEGMRFLTTPDGRYEVSFVTNIPAMPVTLRLQLTVADESGRRFPLTLPPIPIEPKKDFAGNYLGSSYLVRHEGYSRAVANAYDSLGKAIITRRGTARFGSWPEGIERYEILSTSAVSTGAAGSSQSSDSATPDDANSP